VAGNVEDLGLCCESCSVGLRSKSRRFRDGTLDMITPHHLSRKYFGRALSLRRPADRSSIESDSERFGTGEVEATLSHRNKTFGGARCLCKANAVGTNFLASEPFRASTFPQNNVGECDCG
jgi:hypothetical protein